MVRATSKKVRCEMLTKEELVSIHAGRSPWPDTSAPVRPHSSLKEYSSLVSGSKVAARSGAKTVSAKSNT